LKKLLSIYSKPSPKEKIEKMWRERGKETKKRKKEKLSQKPFTLKLKPLT